MTAAEGTERVSSGIVRVLQAPEDGVRQNDIGSVGKVDNGFERTSTLFVRILETLQTQLYKGRHAVFEATSDDSPLRHSLVCWCLVLSDRLNKLEVGLESAPYKMLDLIWHCSAEHESLPVLLLTRRKMLKYLADFFLKTCFEESVCLVVNQALQLWSFDARVRVTEQIEQAARSSDKNMASFSLHLSQVHSLLRTSYCGLYNNAGIPGETPSFDRDLLGKFSSG